MACYVTIISVVQDPVTGYIWVRGGLSAECASHKVDITITCGLNTYTGSALHTSSTWTAVIPAIGCGCGQPITVDAVCSGDPTCGTSFTTNALCCCPQVSTALVYGSCAENKELVTFDTFVYINTPCTFTFRRNFGDGNFGIQYTLTGVGNFNLPPEPHYYAQGTYTSTFDVLTPGGCASPDSVTVVAQCAQCHTKKFFGVLCRILECAFLLSASVGLALSVVTPCGSTTATLSFIAAAVVSLALFLLFKCNKCVCDPLQKFSGQIALIIGIILCMFIIPLSCAALSWGLALTVALFFMVFGFLYLSTWYKQNKTTCPLLICDLWCAVGGLHNTNACTNLAIVGAWIVWGVTGATLTALGISLFVASFIAYIANGPLTTSPCKNSNRICK
jgi:hypothetical protein